MHTFLQVFTQGKNFSRALLKIFSRKDFCFDGEDVDVFLIFSRMGFVFHGYKMKNSHQVAVNILCYILVASAEGRI